MNLAALIASMIDAMAFGRVVNDPLAQWGDDPADRFLGADLLPERPVPLNEYEEESIRYRTPIANHGTRYSPAQLKEGAISGTFMVKLGNSDIAAEFTTGQYEQLIRLMQKAYGVNGGGASGNAGVSIPTMQAMAQMMNWAKRSLGDPLLVRNEKDRWDAIVNAVVHMRGDNGYSEDVQYPNPTGHRTNAGGTWSDDTYDLWNDIIAKVNFLKAKGLTVTRIITTTPVMSIMSNNALMKKRAGRLVVNNALITGLPGRLTLEDLGTLASQDGIPMFETYDKQYFTQGPGATTFTTQGVTFTGNWFLDRFSMVFICGTGRDETIERGDLEPVVVHNTLGYTGIGRAVGEIEPGKVVEVRFRDKGKNKGIEGEGWQTSLPVILDPEAIGVISNIG